jgi:hypothetical protein
MNGLIKLLLRPRGPDASLSATTADRPILKDPFVVELVDAGFESLRTLDSTQYGIPEYRRFISTAHSVVAM